MFNSEREGQMAFFDNYRVPYLNDNSILIDNTDGVYHGNILEFKLNISNTGKVLFQAIQITKELNTSHKEGRGGNSKRPFMIILH